MKKQISGSQSLRKEEKCLPTIPKSSRAKIRISYQGTMLDCAKVTGIERANICRYVAELIAKGRLEKLYRGVDHTTQAKGGAPC